MAKIYGALEVAQLEWFTDAGKPAASSYPYRVIYISDLKQIQVSDGTNWFSCVLSTYTTGTLPTAATSNANTLAITTDTNILYFSNGTVWTPLNPMTTAGDVVYGGTSGIPTRLANGSAGQFLKSNGTTLAPSWANISVTNSVASKTSAYTITTADYTILCDATSAAFAVTLPTAVGITGQQFLIKKIDSTANIVTIATTSSQTIDGLTTQKMGTQYDSILLQSNGSNWVVESNDIIVTAIVKGAAATATAGNPLIFPTIVKDTHGGYSTGTGKYTVPVSGYYDIKVNIQATITGFVEFFVYVDGVQQLPSLGPNVVSANATILNSVQIYATAGQLVNLQQNTNSTSAMSANSGWAITRVK